MMCNNKVLGHCNVSMKVIPKIVISYKAQALKGGYRPNGEEIQVHTVQPGSGQAGMPLSLSRAVSAHGYALTSR